MESTSSSKISKDAPIQIFGVKNSADTRAAERFFKERGVPLHSVDLAVKPMSPGEIRRFVERFGLQQLIDREGKAYVDAGLKYIRMTDPELLVKIETNPKLLKLPLVRAGKILSIGKDEAGWKAMLAGS